MRVSFFKAALLMGALLMGFGAEAQQAPAYLWARGASTMPVAPIGPSGVRPQSLAIAPNGDVYTAYTYFGLLTVNGQTTHPATVGQKSNCALVRQGAGGTITGTLLQGYSAVLWEVKTDVAGNIYASGYFQDSIVTATTTLRRPATDTVTFFVGKWNAAGTPQWLKPLHAQEWTWNTRFVFGVDAADRVTLVGSADQTLTVDTNVIPTPALGQWTPFIVRLNGSTGTVGWVRTGPGTQMGEGFGSLAVDPESGSLLIVGGTLPNSTFTWDGHVLVPLGTPESAYWLRLNAAGDYVTSFVIEPHLLGLPGLVIASAGNDESFLALSCDVPVLINPVRRQLTFHGVVLAAPIPIDHAILVARLAANGTPQWLKLIGLDAEDSTWVEMRALAAAPQRLAPRNGSAPNACYLAGGYTAPTHPFTYGDLTLPQTPLGKNGFVLALDGLTGQTGWVAPAATGPLDAEVNFLAVNAGGQLALAAEATSDSLWFGPLPVIFPTPGVGGAYTAKLVQHYNQLQGTAFADTNRDGQLDPTEARWSGLVVEALPASTFSTTEADGTYSALTDLGTHTVALATPPPYYTLATAPAPATFPGFGNIAPGRDFALQPIANQQDLQVFVTPVNRARPGFGVRYRVTYRNIGTTTTSGTVAVALDARLSYLGNTGGATLSGNTLTATYAALAPGERRAFEIQFQVPTTVAAGTVLATTATVEPVSTDRTPADNTEINQLTVTASYDPNDIAVNWPRLTPTQVTAGEWLEYVIRFENLGTDTAFSVLLRDSLPLAQLNLASLQLTAASHNCTWRLAPGGLLTVTFTSIRLPYRNINAFRSTGFARFRVRPRGTLTLGDVVPNRADIHFDYNAPVRTNTALTTVQLPTGLNADAAATASALSAWPNPTSGTLNVALETPAPGPLHLTVFDQLGRTVLTHTAPDARQPATLDVRALPAGLYVVRATTADGASVGSRRVVVR